MIRCNAVKMVFNCRSEAKANAVTRLASSKYFRDGNTLGWFAEAARWMPRVSA